MQSEICNRWGTLSVYRMEVSGLRTGKGTISRTLSMSWKIPFMTGFGTHVQGAKFQFPRVQGALLQWCSSFNIFTGPYRQLQIGYATDPEVSAVGPAELYSRQSWFVSLMESGLMVPLLHGCLILNHGLPNLLSRPPMKRSLKVPRASILLLL